ncbi:MAG: energy-coupled thiamine transporter ThiT, partial [Oscillospiraceae bacterium]|nr:energy-coupled thiamine transporter ThiT [Oscillospiraceae bacterium]
IMIALATVLSMVTIFKMPLGGSLTPVSMLPICMIAILYGTGWGIGTAFAYALVQLAIDFASAMTWGLTATSLVVCFLFDYILAFTALGLAGLFRKKGTPGIIGGVILALCVRYLCHIISGGTVFAVWMPEEWSNPWIYSAAYNGAFMLPELVLTTVAAFALTKVPAIKKLMKD